jgi:hypothetical protein
MGGLPNSSCGQSRMRLSCRRLECLLVIDALIFSISVLAFSPNLSSCAVQSRHFNTGHNVLIFYLLFSCLFAIYTILSFNNPDVVTHGLQQN